MAIQLDEDGNIERMTREDYEKEIKAVQEQTKQAEAKASALLKAQEEGKVLEPKVKPGVQKPEVQASANMVELRDRLQTLREDIFKLSTNSSADSGVLRAKLERIEAEVHYIHDYVKGGEETPKKKGWLSALGLG